MFYWLDLPAALLYLLLLVCTISCLLACLLGTLLACSLYKGDSLHPSAPFPLLEYQMVWREGQI